MAKKVRVAAVLFSMLSWSMQPLMASSLAMSSQENKNSTLAYQQAHQHSCCPRVHSQAGLTILATLPPPAMPCDRHPCCVQQGPDNSPALPAVQSDSRPDSKQLQASHGIPNPGSSRHISTEPSQNVFDFYAVRSTVLRI